MSNIGKSKKKISQRARSSVVSLDQKRIKESDYRVWAKRFHEFLDSLSEDEFEVAKKTVDLISDRPSKRAKPCEVIQFAKGLNHNNLV